MFLLPNIIVFIESMFWGEFMMIWMGEYLFGVENCVFEQGFLLTRSEDIWTTAQDNLHIYKL